MRLGRRRTKAVGKSQQCFAALKRECLQGWTLYDHGCWMVRSAVVETPRRYHQPLSTAALTAPHVCWLVMQLDSLCPARAISKGHGVVHPLCSAAPPVGGGLSTVNLRWCRIETFHCSKLQFDACCWRERLNTE